MQFSLLFFLTRTHSKAPAVHEDNECTDYINVYFPPKSVNANSYVSLQCVLEDFQVHFQFFQHSSYC